MKVALMFAGQPRFLERGYDYFSKNVLFNNGSTDVYMHMWHDETMSGQMYDAAPWNDGRMECIRGNAPELFQLLYNPVAVRIEKQRHFDIGTDYSSRTGCTPWQIMYSMNYARKQVSLLRQVYETVNNVKYDWCIITRTDWAILEQLDLSKYDPNAINVHNDVKNPRVEVFNDGFIFSSPEHIDRVLTIYDYLSDHWVNNPAINFAQEDLLAVHLRYLELPINPQPIKYGILRANGMDIGDIK